MHGAIQHAFASLFVLAASASGRTPSQLAALKQQSECKSEVATDNNEVMAAAAMGDAEALRAQLANKPELIATTDSTGATLLHFAAFAGHVEATLVLISLENDDLLVATDAFGFRAIDWAVLNSHSVVARVLCAAEGDASLLTQDAEAPLSPLHLAAASGDAEVVAALLAGGAKAAISEVSALELAIALGHVDCAEVLRHATEATAELSIQQRSSPSPSTPLPASIRRVSAATLAADRTAWDQALADSVPLLIDGLADYDGIGWGHELRSWDFAELRRRWGEHEVQVAYSPDEQYQRVVRRQSEADAHTDDAKGQHALCLHEPTTTQMSFATFVDELQAAKRPVPSSEATGMPVVEGMRRERSCHGKGAPASSRVEHLAVTQSRTESLAALDGLCGMDLPPLATTLLATPAAERRANLWCCQPPKVSRLHYDADDSLLLQLAGSKTFRLVDPAPLGGLTAHPTRELPAVPLMRSTRGTYTLGASNGEIRRNFPLVGIDEMEAAEENKDDAMARWPLWRHARTVSVEVPAGSALLLPAFWYHEVESHVDSDDAPNVAVNVWWDSGTAAGMRHGVLRDRLGAIARIPDGAAPTLA